MKLKHSGRRARTVGRGAIGALALMIAAGNGPFAGVGSTGGTAGTIAFARAGAVGQASSVAPREVRVDDPKSLDAAIKAAQPGDVIVMRSGEWKDVEIKFRGTGSADAPITLRAEEGGKTVLTGKSSLKLGGRFLVVDGLAFRDFTDSGHLIAFRASSTEPADDSRLTNVSIESPLRTEADADVQGYWISLYGRRNRVDHCFMQGKKTMSPLLTVWVNPQGDEPDAHRIDHNLFGTREPLGKNGGETIRVGTSEVSMRSAKVLVERNLFRHCDGESEVISNKSCDNVYRGNVFLESKGGLVLRHGNRCLVEGNFFFGNGVPGTGGIRLIGEDHVIRNNYLHGLAGREFESALPVNDGIPNSKPNEYFRVRRAVVTGNTVIDCLQPMTFGVGHGARNRIETPDGVRVENNVFVATSAGKVEGAMIRFFSRPLSVTFAGNVVWGAQAVAPTGEGTWAPPANEGFIVSNPGLSEQAGGVLVPAPGGPAGQAGARPTEPPLQAQDVGPEWMRSR